MNLRKRKHVALRTWPYGWQRFLFGLVLCVMFGAFGVGAAWSFQPPPPLAQPIPEGVLVMRHGTQIERYVSAEPTILCPDGTVRPMSNYRHICEPGWSQP